MGKILKKREFVSFDHMCPFMCSHCYTYELEHDIKARTIDDIVDSISNKEFDIIYVSQKKDNFVYPSEGLELCEKLYDKYKCDIYAITRNVFTQPEMNRLLALNNKMLEENHSFILGVSLSALKSSIITEGNNKLIPSPEQRIEFLKSISKMNIKNILVLRPIYPDKIIPTSEVIDIINDLDGYVDAIVSSGLIVNEHILKRLGLKSEDFNYIESIKSEYFVGAIESEFKYVDVFNELHEIKEICNKIKIPFFGHSMPAINHIKLT